MKSVLLLKVIFITLLLAACSATTTQPATEEAQSLVPEAPAAAEEAALPAPTLFEFTSRAPAINHGRSSDWDGSNTNPGSVIYHDSQFHMFRNGFRGWPNPSQVGYLISTDGLEWAEVQEEAVFRHDQVPFEVDLAFLTTALVEPDGTWVFYFTLFPDTETNRPAGVVRAITPDPLTPWTMDETILLEPGEPGDWDADFIAISKVVKAEDEYRIYYAANSGEMHAIGLATSPDGITWTKHPEPVLTQAQNWEVNIQDPRVVQTPEGWIMLYSSFDGNFNNQGYSIEVSEDGIRWERPYTEPVLERADFQQPPWYPELLYHDGTYYFYLAMNVAGGTGIFVSTFEGNLLPDQN